MSITRIPALLSIAVWLGEAAAAAGGVWLGGGNRQ